MDFIKPNLLKKGDTIGIFTPSSPAYKFNSGLFENGLKNLENLDFKVKPGGLTKNRSGYNSSSMIPYLDFEAIRQARKVICGYSDVTSLHLAVLKYSNLQTFYGPAVMCWFGDWPNGIEQST